MFATPLCCVFHPCHHDKKDVYKCKIIFIYVTQIFYIIGFCNTSDLQKLDLRFYLSWMHNAIFLLDKIFQISLNAFSKTSSISIGNINIEEMNYPHHWLQYVNWRKPYCTWACSKWNYLSCWEKPAFYA